MSAQWRWGELFFGILDRNWGPSGVQGALLSDNPYSMDHLGVALGTRRVQLQFIATQLDTRTDPSGAPVNRFMTQHRIWIHPRGRWTLAFWNGAIVSGVGRQPEPWFLNPAGLTYFRSSMVLDINDFVGVEIERRARVTLFGQFMLDDIQVSRNGLGDLEPASFALTVGAKGRAVTPSATWTFFYTQVANPTYRTARPTEEALYNGLGIGRNFADYDQATAKLGVLLGPTLLVEPEVTVLRQGEGDPRLPYPSEAQFPITPVLFEGVVQRTVRLALGGSWQLRGVSVTGNAGVHLLSNYDHAAGVSHTEFVGSIAVSYRLHHQDVLP